MRKEKAQNSPEARLHHENSRREKSTANERAEQWGLTYIPAGARGENNGVNENLNNKFGNTEVEPSGREVGEKRKRFFHWDRIHSVNLTTELGNHKKDLSRSISCETGVGDELLTPQTDFAPIPSGHICGHTGFSSIMQNQVTVHLGHQILSGNLKPIYFFLSSI